MSLRISTTLIYQGATRRLLDNLERVYNAQEQVTTGKKVQSPSDSPVAFTRIVSYKDINKALDQYQRNITFSRGYLSEAESYLSTVSNILTRVKELTMQGVSQVGNDTAMAAIVSEVESLSEQVVGLANTQWSGGGAGVRYIFSGYKSDTPSFSDAGVYQGDSGEFKVEIGIGEQITVGLAGDRVFQGDVDIFAMLSQIITALETGDSAGIQNGLGEIDRSMAQITNVITEIGGRVNRLDNTETRLKDTSVSIKGMLSQEEDVDMLEAVSNFSLYQTALEATLNSTRMIFDALKIF